MILVNIFFSRLAIVHELLNNDDTKVRAAVVKLMDPCRGHKLLRRRVRHLYPMEVHHVQGSPTQNQDSNSSNPMPEVQDIPVEFLVQWSKMMVQQLEDHVVRQPLYANRLAETFIIINGFLK